jgi:WS/DGAT/MGAT family acyltransferase
MFVRMHHAMADGMAGVAIMGTFLDAVPDEPACAPRSWTPAPLPTRRELFADNLRRRGQAFAVLTRPATVARRMRAAWPALRGVLAAGPEPTTSLNRMVGPDRDLALIRTDLDVVRQIAQTHRATVNDVLLTIAAGGLRALLHGRGEAVEDLTVRVYVPLTLRQPSRRAQARGNLIAQMVVPLPVGVSDPGRRLRQIAAETARRKAGDHPSLGSMFHGRVARWLLLKALARQPVNVTTADLPGPREPRYLAGARLLEVFPVLPLIANVSLGIGALSYAGQFNVMVVADRDAYPDLGVFMAAARHELGALAPSRHPMSL